MAVLIGILFEGISVMVANHWVIIGLHPCGLPGLVAAYCPSQTLGILEREDWKAPNIGFIRLTDGA